MTRRLFPAFVLLAACATTPTDRTDRITATPAAPTLVATNEPPRADPLSPPADVAAPPSDAVDTGGGLYAKMLRAGTGTAHPSAFSVVSVHYTGWTTDGQMFDSSVKRGAPAQFPLNGVISGWRNGVKQMVVGEKRRFWIPEEMAYKGMSGPQGMLVFEIELLDIVQP